MLAQPGKTLQVLGLFLSSILKLACSLPWILYVYFCTLLVQFLPVDIFFLLPPKRFN